METDITKPSALGRILSAAAFLVMASTSAVSGKDLFWHIRTGQFGLDGFVCVGFAAYAVAFVIFAFLAAMGRLRLGEKALWFIVVPPCALPNIFWCLVALELFPDYFQHSGAERIGKFIPFLAVTCILVLWPVVAVCKRAPRPVIFHPLMVATVSGVCAVLLPVVFFMVFPKFG